MKNIIIGALILLVVCVPPLIIGALPLKLLLAFVTVFGCYEFTSIRSKRLNIVLWMMMVVFVLTINIFPNNSTGIIVAYIILLFFCGILSDEVSMDDISSSIMMGMIIAFGMMAIIRIYEKQSYLTMLYIAFATFGCDIGALLTGMKFGKHKLIPRISPNKTIEGAIGGWLSGALASFIFATLVPIGINQPYIIFYSLTLPLIAQLGDLSFSLIKRNYGVKDYGSLIPGHGGVLDRIDSLLFCLLFYGLTFAFLGL